MIHRSALAIVYVAMILLASTVVIALWFEIPFGDLTRDPLSVVDGEPYYGLLSNLGAIFWSFSTIIPFFTYSVLYFKISRHSKLFLLFSGSISLVLLLDDFLMMHDKIIPYFLGLNEVFVLALYILIVGFYLIYFRKAHLRSDYPLLLIALFLFGISIIVDYFQGAIESDLRPIIEDGPKFLGISFWTAYQFTLCRELTLDRIKK